MEERVSSWRIVFVLACALLMLASIPPDRLLDPLGRSSKVYDSARPLPERALDPPTVPRSPARDPEPEIALSPNLRLACVPHARPREVGPVPFERSGRSSSRSLFHFVSDRRISPVQASQASIRLVGSRSVPSIDSSAPRLDGFPPAEEAADVSEGIPVVLESPHREFNRRSYAELMERYDSDTSSGSAESRPEQVIALPSPPPGEVRAPSWTEPRSLLEALAGLEGSQWATRAAELIESLKHTGSERFTERLNALTLEYERTPAPADLSAGGRGGEFRKVTAALERRMELWNAMSRAGWPREVAFPGSSTDRRRTVEAVDRVERWLRSVPNRDEWAEFLCLGEIRELAAGAVGGEEPLRKASRKALGRLIDTPWSPEERNILALEPLAGFAQELRTWAEEPVDFGWLLKVVERFEAGRDPEDAYRLAKATRTLRMSASDATRAVGETLDRHYRNANFMMRVQTDFLNRFAPQREAEYEWVRDVILGQPVRGNARTESAVHFRAIPAKDRILLALEVEGRVSSLTSADAGPAVLLNNSHSNYLARKEIAIDAEGLTYQPSTAQVASETRLRGLRTALDPIPLVGALVQDMVLSRHQQQKPLVHRELQRKVAARATQRVDEEANPRLDQLARKYREEVLSRLSALGIAPELIDAETMDDGFVAAFRLAAGDQLASYEPPPVLDADAEAAIWLHESFFNNLLERMDFNGRTFTAEELTNILSGGANESIAERHEDVRVTFAPTRAARISCGDDVVELTLAVRELVRGTKSWNNFFVRAKLKPTLEGKQIKLVRTGVVGLYGRKFRIQSQIALRGIFSKVFDDDRPFEVLPADFSEDDRLAELQIAALAVRHGWIVFALNGKTLRVAQNAESSGTIR